MTYHKTVRKPIPDYTTYNSPFATEKKPAYRKPARPKKVDKRVEEVYDAFTTTEIPSDDESFVILKCQKEMPENYRLDFNEKYVSGLDHKQALLLAGLIGEMTEHKYRLPSLERTFDEVQKNFWLMKLMKKGWMHNDEVILKDGHVRYGNTTQRATWPKYSYHDSKDVVRMDTNDTVATLIKADLFHRTYPSYPNLISIASDSMHFDQDGYASVNSCWDSKKDAFYAEAGVPYRRNRNCFIALVRSD